MKKITLPVILILLSLPLFAQKISFTNNTNTWSMIDSTPGCCIPYPTRFTTAYYDGKVSYKGNNYQILHYDFGSCMVREANGKVYCIGNIDSTERVLYDFTLQVNDTIRFSYQYDTYTSWVSSMDSTQLYGIWYKVWHFDGKDTNNYTNKTFTYQYNVIEGIGCTNGVYYPVIPYDYSSYSDQLLCFANNMDYTTGLSTPVLSYGYDYTAAFDNNISCTKFRPVPSTPEDPEGDNTLSTTNFINNSGDPVVIPNPVVAVSRIVLPYEMRSGKLIVIDEIGRTVANISFHNKRTISIADQIQVPGIYFYRVIDEQNGKIYSGKFTR